MRIGNFENAALYSTLPTRVDNGKGPPGPHGGYGPSRYARSVRGSMFKLPTTSPATPWTPEPRNNCSSVTARDSRGLDCDVNLEALAKAITPTPGKGELGNYQKRSRKQSRGPGKGAPEITRSSPITNHPESRTQKGELGNHQKRSQKQSPDPERGTGELPEALSKAITRDPERGTGNLPEALTEAITPTWKGDLEITRSAGISGRFSVTRILHIHMSSWSHHVDRVAATW